MLQGGILRELFDAATKIYVFDREAHLLRAYAMKDLLPDSFGPENVAEMQGPA
jgi:cytidine deaminase